jgi:hypothetical protein
MKLFIRSTVLLFLMLSVDVFAASSEGVCEERNIPIILEYGFAGEPSSTRTVEIETLSISKSIPHIDIAYVEAIKGEITKFLLRKNLKGDQLMHIRSLTSCSDKIFSLESLSKVLAEIKTPLVSRFTGKIIKDKILLIYLETNPQKQVTSSNEALWSS